MGGERAGCCSSSMFSSRISGLRPSGEAGRGSGAGGALDASPLLFLAGHVEQRNGGVFIGFRGGMRV